MTTALERLQDWLRAQLRKPSAGDVSAKAAELGFDRDRIFSFVRDKIRYEPYRGVLRGPAGTLACGSGNSADRSLLLRALLEAAGLSSRPRSGTGSR